MPSVAGAVVLLRSRWAPTRPFSRGRVAVPRPAWRSQSSSKPAVAQAGTASVSSATPLSNSRFTSSATRQRRACSATRAKRGGAPRHTAPMRRAARCTRNRSRCGDARASACQGQGARRRSGVCADVGNRRVRMSSYALCTVVLSAEGQVPTRSRTGRPSPAASAAFSPVQAGGRATIHRSARLRRVVAFSSAASDAATGRRSGLPDARAGARARP